MTNSLLQYDVLLKQENVKLIMCNQFYEGVYIPENNKVMICANTTMEKKDFNNALTRQLIFMYDHNRSNGMHDLNKCKHLACSEVRATLFTDKCKIT